MFRRLNILSLTSRASVLARSEYRFSDNSRALIIVGVQLQLVVGTVNWDRSEDQVWVRIFIRIINVRVCRAVGGVAVISCVVGSSSFQCSNRADKLWPCKAFELGQSTLSLFFPVEVEGKNAFRFIFGESVKIISWCCPAYVGCYLVDISNSLLTLWLLHCCFVGHVVLVSNPG